MRGVRLSILTTAVVSLLTLAPAGASAQTVTLPLPCVDAVVVQVNCTPPAPAKKPACANAKLVPTDSNAGQIRAAILCLLNRERHRRHLSRLHSNPTLGAAARSFAEELVREQFFDHTAPDGTTMLDRILQTSYLTITPRRWWVGENIGYATHGADTPSAIVSAWMHSTEHRRNILSPHYRDIGLGAASGTPIGRPGTTYVTDFGRRIR